MIREPAQFHWKLDKRRSLALYGEWADEAWREQSLSCAELVAPPEYAIGFRDGFVDYVYAGGNGEPPPVPPRKLWNVSLRGPDGRERAAQWFEGYRHGARVAQAGGYRSYGTVQSSVMGYADDGRFGYRGEADQFHPNQLEPPETDVEPLPLPPPERPSPALRKSDAPTDPEAAHSPREEDALQAEDILLEQGYGSATAPESHADNLAAESAPANLIQVVRLSALPQHRLVKLAASPASTAADEPPPQQHSPEPTADAAPAGSWRPSPRTTNP